MFFFFAVSSLVRLCDVQCKHHFAEHDAATKQSRLTNERESIHAIPSLFIHFEVINNTNPNMLMCARECMHMCVSVMY